MWLATCHQPTLPRRHFQMHFFYWKYVNFDYDFTAVCSQGSIIGSDNGLAPARRLAIIWPNDGLVYWRIYASLGLNELKARPPVGTMMAPYVPAQGDSRSLLWIFQSYSMKIKVVRKVMIWVILYFYFGIWLRIWGYCCGERQHIVFLFKLHKHVFSEEHTPLSMVQPRWSQLCRAIDQFHKSQNTPAPYPTMFHSEQKCAHFCSEWSIVRYGTGIYSGICELG